MRLDCSSCEQRDRACGDCVVTLLMSLPNNDPVLSGAEEAALAVLAASGLVPPLRLANGKRTV